jgi:hypothetical protein
VADLRWNDQAGRFTDSAGRFVSEARVRVVVDAVADQASARMAAASERMLAGQMSLASWQAEMQNTIKVSHLAASVLAHGGESQMSFSHYGSAGRAIRDQYQYLKGMAADIAAGRQPLNGGLTARARQYGQAARVAFEREYGRDQQGRGYQFERNVLGAADHCALCPELTARGWVPIGSLPPVGSRPCRAQDRCSIRYARTAEGSVAA